MTPLTVFAIPSCNVLSVIIAIILIMIFMLNVLFMLIVLNIFFYHYIHKVKVLLQYFVWCNPKYWYWILVYLCQGVSWSWQTLVWQGSIRLMTRKDHILTRSSRSGTDPQNYCSGKSVMDQLWTSGAAGMRKYFDENMYLNLLVYNYISNLLMWRLMNMLV